MEENWMWIAAAAGAGVLVLLLIVMMMKRGKKSKHDEQLRTEFKGEYDEAARDHSRKETVRELDERKARVDGYNLRELSADEARSFSARWRTVKAEFIRSPSDAVIRADELLASIMLARGYDVNIENSDRAIDISVGHPDEAMAYREVTQIADRNSRGEASTEDLRYAMVGYEKVVESMLGNRVAA